MEFDRNAVFTLNSASCLMIFSLKLYCHTQELLCWSIFTQQLFYSLNHLQVITVFSSSLFEIQTDGHLNTGRVTFSVLFLILSMRMCYYFFFTSVFIIYFFYFCLFGFGLRQLIRSKLSGNNPGGLLNPVPMLEIIT